MTETNNIEARFSLTSAMRFRWPWRDYQARVLASLEAHLSNKRLHIVAAPGSGKTVLGLEVFRRLDRPTVVLSPTRTIRDQWVERLGDFLDGQDPTTLPWKSRDLSSLNFFNSLTYQALHTKIRLAAAEAGDLEAAEAEELEDEVDGRGPSGQEVREVIECFEAAGIGTLILDEAHHLRAEWWSALQQIVEALPDLILVSLTATPPYDVVGHEWSRYIELCGPIDEEISVPELVKAGTLCPHQDYIWLVRSEGGIAQRLTEHRKAVEFLILDLSGDEKFLTDLADHPWSRNPDSHTTRIMQSPDAAVAMAALLAQRGHAAPALMQAMDLSKRDLPVLDHRLWEHLLRHYLFGADWPDSAEFKQRQSALARRMRSERLLWRRELNLADAGRNWPRLSLSSEKARACLDIHRLECSERGDSLRQVILTDYIRDEDYRQPVQRELPLGAWPIFYRLARGASPCRTPALALHSGRLTIVHHTLVDRIQASMPARTVQTRKVPALSEFRQMRVGGGQRLTRALTHLLIEGEIQVLVGTRALLGEGWDAPPVNSLILASVVGSFMTTNQMRGRAIRVDPANPGKVASIWHIGAFTQFDEIGCDVRDLAEMVNRFETFVGLSHREPVIEGGIDRLSPGFRKRDRFSFPILEKPLNRKMAERLAARNGLPERWQRALDQSEIGRVLPTLRTPSPLKLKVFTFWGTFRVLLAQFAAVALAAAGVLQQSLVLTGPRGSGQILITIGIGLFLLTAPAAFRLGRLFFRFLPVDGAIRAIALAVREALCDAELLPASHYRTRLICQEHSDGGWSIALSHGSFAEQSLFADCMHQVLAPVERPRYLITRRQYRFNRHYTDFHAVPTILGARKDRAEIFLRAWRERVCPAELIYTRNPEGRLILLKARMRAFANARQRQAKRMDRWF